MSYEVIARKWRPRRFDEVIGQNHISDILKHSVKTGRLASVYLFTGIRGTGKTTLARVFVRSLNCLNPESSGEPCNKCENCLEILKGLSPDVIEIDGASNNSVEDIRLIKENVAYHPIKSKYKIYIIDEVHMLSKSAFNALLKTLEEPPSYVIFIMATTDPQKIPVTVLSRCQRYDLRRLSTKEVVMQLSRIIDAEGRSFDEEALYSIAREGEGSMRDSQTLLEQIMTLEDGSLTENSVEIILGQSGKEHIRNLLTSVIHKNSSEALDILRKMRDGGASSEKIIKDMISLLHQIIIYLEIRTFDFLDASDEEKKWIKGESDEASPPDWIRLFDFLTESYVKIKNSELADSILEVSILSAVSFPVMADISAIASFFSKAAETVAEESKKKSEEIVLEPDKTQIKKSPDFPEEENEDLCSLSETVSNFEENSDYFENELNQVSDYEELSEYHIQKDWKGFLNFINKNGMLFGFLCNQRFEENNSVITLYIDPDSVHFEYFRPEIERYSNEFFGVADKIVYKHLSSTKETFVELERIEEQKRIEETEKKIKESDAVKEFLNLGFSVGRILVR